MLPEGQGALVDLDAWTLPPVFRWLAETGGMEQAELLKTFNCGLGMILAVAPGRVAPVRAALEAAGETVVQIGRVQPGDGVSYLGSLV